LDNTTTYIPAGSHDHLLHYELVQADENTQIAFSLLLQEAGDAWANWDMLLEASSIQMEWLHSDNEGNLQTSEGTIYEFVPLQRISLQSAKHE
jgi:hypothetical protein